MKKICLACSTMVLIYLLTMFHQFFLLYGYYSSYQLLKHCPNECGDDYFYYNVSKYVIFYFICYDL